MLFRTLLSGLGLLPLAALAMTATASAQPATVTGSVVIDGRTTALTHVTARETRPSPFGGSTRIKVLVSDRQATPAVAGSSLAYYDAAREGRIIGGLLTLGPRPDDASFALFRQSSVSDERIDLDPSSPFPRRLELTDLVRANGWVSGRIRSVEPVSLQPQDPDPGPESYTIDVRFRVPITPSTPPTAELTGAAARTSPQTAAAIASLRTIHTGTPQQLVAQLHPDHPFRGNAAGLMEIAREALPQPAAFAAAVTRVIVYGEEAVVMSGRSDNDRSFVWLRLHEGRWLLQAAPSSSD